MSTLLMIRHGESTANVAARYTWHDDEPLTELGRRQARETGRRLAEQYRPAHLYCSRFRRARQTADGIAAEVGLPVVEIDGIQERYFGELRGKPWAVYREVVSALEIEDLWHHPAPGGAGRAGGVRAGRAPPGGAGDRGLARRRDGGAARLDRRHLDEPAETHDERGRLSS